MAGRLEGRVAIITGGADGIGRGVVERFMGEGAKVLFADIDAAAGERAARETGASFFACDVTRRDAVEAMVADAVDRFGTVDCLVNNAWGGGSIGRIEHKTDIDIQHGITMGFYAAMWAMRC